MLHVVLLRAGFRAVSVVLFLSWRSDWPVGVQRMSRNSCAFCLVLIGLVGVWCWEREHPFAGGF